ncbi:MAG: Gfo/Idh/MocA family oxidoreductase [Actinobacteria bacterium]|nr:Gfo/Idh/MocA family oxidoreductase [Actinomycetota bacterium]
MLKIAIVGAGFIGKIHAASFKDIPDAKVNAIVDTSRDSGEKLASQANAEYVPDLDTLLEKKDIDGIIIATPQFLHYDMLKKIAERKKPVLCEKPLALTMNEADEMVKIVKDKKIIAMTGHVIRFYPEYQKAKNIAESGTLGEILCCYSERFASPPDWASWRFDEKYSGGAALDLHIHDLDFLSWLFGKPVSITSVAVNNPDYGGIAHITSMVRFNDDKSGVANGGWNYPDSFPFTAGFKILCRNGAMQWGFIAGKNIEGNYTKPDFLMYKPGERVVINDIDKTDSFVLEDRYFVSCIKNNRQAEVATFEDGRNTLGLALAAVSSAKEQKTLYL